MYAPPQPLGDEDTENFESHLRNEPGYAGVVRPSPARRRDSTYGCDVTFGPHCMSGKVRTT